MKLIECADKILVGFNAAMLKKEKINSKSLCKYRQLTIASVDGGFLDENLLTSYDGRIDPKFLTQIGDIIICSKPPFNVILISREEEEGILVPHSFIIIRDAKLDCVYLYNLICISKDKIYNIVNSKKVESENNRMLGKADLEGLELLELNDKSIEKLANICTRINNRQYSYNKLIKNDDELIKILFKKEVDNYER